MQRRSSSKLFHLSLWCILPDRHLYKETVLFYYMQYYWDHNLYSSFLKVLLDKEQKLELV